MDYTSEQLKEIEKGDMYVDSRGLNIRLDTKTIRGYLIIRKIAEAAKRPVSAFGDAYADQAYVWITIPLTKVIKGHDFDNFPKKTKNK